MQCYYVIFKGRVQGVGFRYITALKAAEMNIKGDVTNLANGDVACHFEGETAAVLALINYLRKASYFIRIDDYIMKEIPLRNYADFRVR